MASMCSRVCWVLTGSAASVQARRLAAQRQGQLQERLRRERERAEEAQQRQRDARVRLITSAFPPGPPVYASGQRSAAQSWLRWHEVVILVSSGAAAWSWPCMHENCVCGCTAARCLHPGGDRLS